MSTTYTISTDDPNAFDRMKNAAAQIHYPIYGSKLPAKATKPNGKGKTKANGRSGLQAPSGAKAQGSGGQKAPGWKAGALGTKVRIKAKRGKTPSKETLKIRALAAKGWDTARIAKKLGLGYQRVYQAARKK